MSEDRSFHGSVKSGGPKDGRLTALVVLVVVAFVGLAIVKPWGSTVAPSPSPSGGLPTAVATPPAASTSATTPPVPSPAPSLSLSVLPLAYTTRLPPASSTWTGLDWRRLAPDDPLSLVTSVVQWRHGFVAVGWSSGSSATPVWTSPDGANWEPLPFNTATTFWPGLLVVGVVEVRGGLVALTVLSGTWDCSAANCPTYSPMLSLMAWTSSDGRSWTPGTSPDIGPASGSSGPPIVAAGPAGVVVASPTPPARLATSVDGIHWRTVAADALPTGLTITGMVGTTTGFTAVGTLQGAADHYRAVAFHSDDGAIWTRPFPLDLFTASAFTFVDTGLSWGATALVAGRDGLMVIGQVLATPGATLWWQTTDGTDARGLPTYPPLGPTTCTGEGCGSQPNGTLVGDGHRMVALRGGADAGVWTSTDGLVWHRVHLTGDIPTEQATQAVLMPGGVLLSDGTTTWFGEALGG